MISIRSYYINLSSLSRVILGPIKAQTSHAILKRKQRRRISEKYPQYRGRKKKEYFPHLTVRNILSA